MNNKIGQLVGELAVQDFAVGNDLVFGPDFNASFNEGFREKVFTAGEIAYCDRFDQPLLRFASTWAAKEAVYKAIKQLYAEPLGFKKIEIVRSGIAGIPHVNLPERLAHLQVSLSISHDGDYIWAIAMVKKEI